MKGAALLARLCTDKPDIGRILLTAVPDSIPYRQLLNEAQPLYVPKGPDLIEELAAALKKAVASHCEKRRQGLERTQLRAVLRLQTSPERLFTDLIGTDPVLQSAIKAGKVAANHAHLRVLITGETGTGKDYIARAIHFQGARRDHPFVKYNCAHLQRHLAQSVLFGHEKFSFTEAREKRNGIFRDADKGTLFLDEVGDVDLESQPTLLDFFDGGEIRPLGYSGKRITADVRIISATNLDLNAEVSAGRFRADLYARLKGIEIRMPPLRDRKADIPLIARHFVMAAARDYGLDGIPIGKSVDVYLQSLPYPFNFRSLSNIVNMAVLEMVIAGAKTLELDHVRKVASNSQESSLPARGSLDDAIVAFTNHFMEAAIIRNNYNNLATAKEIGRTDRYVREWREKFNFRSEK